MQICSNALLMLGAQTIHSFDDDSDRALLMSNLWPNARDAVLRAHPWNCAVKRVQLSPASVGPAFDYPYRFLLPGDWLRTLSVGQRGEHPQFEIEGRYILMSDAVCNLRYVFRNEDVASWDALLVEAAEAYMAMTAAYPITKSASQQDTMARLYEFKLRAARTVDGQEQPGDTVGDMPLINVRR